MRDAFGNLLIDPEELDVAGRQEEFRRAIGELLAGSRRLAWIGRCCQDWVHSGGPLERALGLVPQQGSRSTVAARVRLEEQDRARRRLIAAAGNPARAARIAERVEPCPVACQAALAEVIQLGASTSVASFRRALGRASDGR